MKKNLRVFSYNIHKGFGWGLKNFTLREMRVEMRKIHPDLIFLQEVHGHHARHQRKIPHWPDGSQFEYLAEDLWPHFTYGKNAVYVKGDHGNAILSKFPILSWENLDISENRFEKRGLLHAVVEISKKQAPIHVFCVHLNLLEKDRQKQATKLIKRIKSKVPPDAPVIVAGDFNDWSRNVGPRLEKQLRLEEACLSVHGDYPKTFPSFFPAMSLDRIYSRGFKTVAARCLNKKPWNGLSDHLPLEAELRLNAGP